MSEADAEDGPHGLDAYHSGMNEGTIVDLGFSDRFFLPWKKPDRTLFRPFNFKNAFPRQIEKAWKGGRG